MTTYCGVIKATILVQTCPLRPGRCYWQGEGTNLCRYTEQPLSLDDYSKLVGRSITTEGYEKTYLDLKSKLTGSSNVR